MRSVEIKKTRKVVPIRVENDLSRRHVESAATPRRRGSDRAARSAPISCHGRTQVEKEKDTQHKRHATRRDCSEHTRTRCQSLGHDLLDRETVSAPPVLRRQTRRVRAKPCKPWLKRKSRKQHGKWRPVLRNSFPTRSHDHQRGCKQQKEERIVRAAAVLKVQTRCNRPTSRYTPPLNFPKTPTNRTDTTPIPTFVSKSDCGELDLHVFDEQLQVMRESRD